MPPKVSKKTADKVKAKVIEDKTFGLKNKNRSAKVQAFVQNVTQSVKQGSAEERKRQAEFEQKKAAKEAKKAIEAEMARLFKAVPTAAGVKPAEGEEDVDKNYGVNPEDYLWTADDFDAVEEDDSRLEERLEAEREALKGRTDLTPVTEESFQIWKAKKRQEAAEKEAARVRAAKEKGGLRGWDLWQHDQALFVDDDEADDEYYEQEEIEEEAGEEGVHGSAVQE